MQISVSVDASSNQMRNGRSLETLEGVKTRTTSAMLDSLDGEDIQSLIDIVRTRVDV